MKSRRSIRGLSPIFATLILIAIAVIAGIIVYMFTSGTLSAMLGGGTAGQEKIAIQSATGDSTASTVDVIYQWTGGPKPTIDSILLKDAAGNTVGVSATNLGVTPSASGVVDATSLAGTGITMTGSNVFTPGNTYTVTLVTAAGGSFVSSSFVAT